MLESTRLGNDRVLVVDDDDALRDAHVRVLREAGFCVEAAESGLGAAKRLQQGERFLVIVTDLVMPEMDGIDLLSRVRQLDPDLPVVIVTGRPSLQSTIAAVEHHSFRYLIKPVTPVQLRGAVNDAAATHRLARLKRRAYDLCGGESWSREQGSLDERLDRALAQLFMVYQPIVSPESHRVFGFEALVRAGEAFASPDQLFAAAEKRDRIHELGRAIRDLVSRDLPRAPQGCAVFVNLHAGDLTDPELFAPTAALAKHAPRVVLEVTERKSIDAVPDVRRRLDELRSLGYRVAIDDLGAGYAGLSSFTLLEPDIVKLDMSLVRGIDTSSKKRALVESMVRVCVNDLGVQVVCEGVETAGERDALVEMGTPLLQGYFFARPAREFVVPEALSNERDGALAASDFRPELANE